MNKDNWSNYLAGVVAAIILAIIVLGFVFCIYALFTKLLIWVVNGIWNYDLSDSFWQVFVGLLLVSSFIKPSISIEIDKK